MESVIQENTSLKVEIARLQSAISSKDTTIAAKDATIATKDADGLDLALQIRFKTDELAAMTKTIAMQRALLASQGQEKDMLKTFLESTSYEKARLEGSYNLLRAAMAKRVQADGEEIAELETSVGDWQDMWMEERSRCENLLDCMKRVEVVIERALENFQDLMESVQVRPRE